MLLKSIITKAFFASTALACAGHMARSTSTNDTNTGNNPFTLGSDAPADSATTGYFMNHVALNVHNLTRSIAFYSNVFGMRHMFTFQASPHLSFTYMSHSQGGRNGSAYQTTEEMIRLKNNNGGHLEFFHMNVEQDPRPTKPQKTNTVNHLGFIVPDLQATQARLEEHGVTIYKKLGEPVSEDGYLADKFWLGDATNLSDEEFESIKDAMTEFNRLTIFAADPDGNLLEILPLNEGSFLG